MDQCNARVPNYIGFGYSQCSRNAVKDGYCKQHHPDAVKQREEESLARYQAKLAKSPYAKLSAALKRNAELEERIKALEEVLDCAFEWIDAIPRDTVLPSMPGFDRDWADNVRNKQ